MNTGATRAIWLIGLLMAWPAIACWAQDEGAAEKGGGDEGYKMNLQLLDTEDVLDVAVDFDVDRLGAKLKEAIAIAEPVVAGVGAPDQAVALRFTLFPDKDYEVELFARPELAEAEREKLLKGIGSIKLPRSNLLTLKFQFGYLRGAPPAVEEGKNWPEGSVPGYVRRALAFEKADIAGKVTILRRWSREVVLPLLGAYQRRAEAQFAGVVGMGKLLGKTDLSKPLDIDKLIDSNDNYWRGMLEMDRGNALIVATRIFAEIANGNIEEAARFAGLHGRFLSDDVVISNYIKEFLDLHEVLRKQINPKIEAAIAAFDKGDFQAAIEQSEAILAAHPRDPWARYELWFSQQQLAAEEEPPAESQPWHEAAREIYSMDSMYPIAASARNDREGFEMASRMALKEIKPATNDEEFQANQIKRADLALDLGVYNFAAEAYWIILNHFPKKAYNNRKLEDFAFYSIDRAGGKGVIALLEEDRARTARAPERQLQKRFESNPTYGKFKQDAGE